MGKKLLRSGYTTGACAAAAAKAAVLELLSAESRGLSLFTDEAKRSRRIGTVPGHAHVEVPFPDGSRVKFKVHSSKLITKGGLIARASVIKDAGDDPDVTNGAEIVAEVRGLSQFTDEAKRSRRIGTVPGDRLIILGGKGVGTVTKPGLSVPVGEPAINPVPRKMITDAVTEAISQYPFTHSPIHPFTGLHYSPIHRSFEITISVPDGEQLAKKTLNYRLGIVGGISILGTTGIVRPISAEAWTATIISSMDVAKAMGHKEIVLSAGRTSEKAHMEKYGLSEESYVMMGDYLEFSLMEAKKHGFKNIHLCAQWAKMLKIAMATPQTHVRHGAIDIEKAKELLRSLGLRSSDFKIQHFNTAREIFDFINSRPKTRGSELLSKVCFAAGKYAEGVAGARVKTHLVSYEGDIIAGN